MKEPVFSKAAHRPSDWEMQIADVAGRSEQGAQSAQRGIAEFIGDFCGTRVRDARGLLTAAQFQMAADGLDRGTPLQTACATAADKLFETAVRGLDTPQRRLRLVDFDWR